MTAEDLPEPDRLEDAPHPRETPVLYGHADAEAEFLRVHGAGRLHHAWLLTGPEGIGKATLAWRLARFLLAEAPEPEAGLFGDAPAPPASLEVPADHPVAKRLAALSEPRMFLMRRPFVERTGKLSRDITIDVARKMRSFLRLSAADGGRRIVLIDAADDMNPSAANAVLKLLEEPPADTVFLLVSHRPSRLLPTIRSRCRVLRLDPLSGDALSQALTAATQTEIEQQEMRTLLALSDGSVGRALKLHASGGGAAYRDLVTLFDSLPRLDREKALELSEPGNPRAAPERFDLIVALTELILFRLARTGATGAPPEEAVPGETAMLVRLSPDPATARHWAAASQELMTRARRGMAVNLDPATLLLDMFHGLQAVASKRVPA